jgi:murein L,D-transpeptidase YcbB/YkuD
MPRRLMLALMCLMCMWPPTALYSATPQTLTAEVRERLRYRIEAMASGQPIVIDHTRLHTSDLLQQVYEQRAYRPAWSHDKGPLLQAEALFKVLQEVPADGLNAQDYHLAQIEGLLQQVRQAQAAPDDLHVGRLVDLDLLLTDAFLLYASHALTGRVNPETIKAEWFTNPREANVVGILRTALDTGRVAEALHALFPMHPEYARLRDTLAHYRTRAAVGGWPRVPDGAKLQRGDRDPRVSSLRQRLLATGDLEPTSENEPDRFDEGLEQALRRFQMRHGLDSDGVVGPATLAALNVPIAERIRQIMVNMERWRWLPQALGSRYILVNIAAGTLKVVASNQTVMNMRVIVGRAYRRTPVFSGRMTYLVLNPSWHIPPRLAVQDKLPLIRRDPTYLAKQRITVLQGWGATGREIDPNSIDWHKVSAKNFPYRLRQEPGPMNALGRIKFMFPNRFNVYLHDTLSRELFARRVRMFSSGCIRIEKPIELATYVLQDNPKWTRDAILAAIARSTEQTVQIPDPVTVHLLYWTAWADADGTVHFGHDIYGRDNLLDKALQEKLSAS